MAPTEPASFRLGGQSTGRGPLEQDGSGAPACRLPTIRVWKQFGLGTPSAAGPFQGYVLAGTEYGLVHLGIRPRESSLYLGSA